MVCSVLGRELQESVDQGSHGHRGSCCDQPGLITRCRGAKQRPGLQLAGGKLGVILGGLRFVTTGLSDQLDVEEGGAMDAEGSRRLWLRHWEAGESGSGEKGL